MTNWLTIGEPEVVVERVFYPQTGCDAPHYLVRELSWQAKYEIMEAGDDD